VIPIRSRRHHALGSTLHRSAGEKVNNQVSGGYFVKSILCSVLFVIASAPLALAQGTYTQIDYPGAATTACYGINTAGDVVGYYVTGGSVVHAHGFLLSGGAFTTIDYPFGTDTILTGINDMGQIVGTGQNELDPPVGFLYDMATQSFTTIADPLATETYPFSINNAGTIAGYSYFANGGVTSGFELAGTTYKSIKPPKASVSYVWGISASGVLVGDVPTMKQTNVDFLFKHGSFDSVTIPNAPGAVIYGINPGATALVGYYQPVSGTEIGILYDGKTTQMLQLPGESQSFAYGVNEAGEVVGQSGTGFGNVHGFTWTPSAHAATK
jgi:probable HAF family extracellular repeat protein